MSSQRCTQLLLTLATALILGACAHDIKPVALPADSNPNMEVDALGTAVDAARNKNIDVLAPENFKKAEGSLKEAQERRSKNKKGEKILESVGFGKAYLDRAQVVAQKSREQLPDVLKARDLAMANGATVHHKERVNLDQDLKKLTLRIEDGKSIDRDELAELQQDYLNLELKSIKTVKLSEARSTLENAEKQGAKRMVPKAYQDAKEKLDVAEKTIDTDRHNTQMVDQQSGAAVASAQRAMTLLQTAKENKNRSPEQIASEIENRNTQLDQADAMNAATKAEVSAGEKRLAHERAEAGVLAEDRERLAARERFNQAFDKVQADFNKDEADVYRQGDNMIIRLKSVKFSPGRSELPSTAFTSLKKVKDVIEELKPQDVIVEGHTDSTGKAAANKKLSTQRAEVIANYFVADASLDSKSVEAVGFGDEKPIANNKSKSGREMNRRVDIVIKPAGANGKAPTPQPNQSTQ